MTKPICLDRWSKLSEAARRFGTATTVDRVIELLTASAREIAGADGVKIGQRDGDEVVMLCEDAVSPFGKGKRFTLDRSLCGMVMQARKPVLVDDMRMASHVPFNAYLSTFVSTVATFPVGNEPFAAIGIYWIECTPIDEETALILDSLARSAGSALEGLKIRAEVDAMRTAARRQAHPVRTAVPMYAAVAGVH